MFPYSKQELINQHKETGMTLVITLLLVLTLTVMASAVTFVVNSHADMTNQVTQKPIAIESADACIEEAIAWVQTTDGQAWLDGTEVTGIDSMGYGTGAVKDIAAEGGTLYGKNLKLYTKKKVAETRSSKFQTRLEKASCTSVNLTVIKKTTDADEDEASLSGVGGEIGSEAEYGEEAAVGVIPYKYEILVVAEGIFNVATTGGGTTVVKGAYIASAQWLNANISKIEVLFSYQQ